MRIQERVPIYATQLTIDEVRKTITYIRTDEWKALKEGKETTIEGIKVRPIDGKSAIVIMQ